VAFSDNIRDANNVRDARTGGNIAEVMLTKYRDVSNSRDHNISIELKKCQRQFSVSNNQINSNRTSRKATSAGKLATAAASQSQEI
jgi:hypothetical protein